MITPNIPLEKDGEVKSECSCHEEVPPTWEVLLMTSIILFLVLEGLPLLGGFMYGTERPRRFTEDTGYHEASGRLVLDECDMKGKWNYVFPTFTIACRFTRWMGE